MGKLAKIDVDACRRKIYHRVGKRAHGNERCIKLRAKDFTPNEMAALIAYYKMQDNCPDALDWEVVHQRQSWSRLLITHLMFLFSKK